MSSSHFRSFGSNSNNRYSAAAKAVKPVNFICLAPEAQAVHLTGDFNDWHSTSNPMKRHVDGSWQVQVSLGPGHHHYWFMIDGKPHLDPRAQGIARNEKNEKVSMVSVS